MTKKLYTPLKTLANAYRAMKEKRASHLLLKNVSPVGMWRLINEDPLDFTGSESR
jgi:hypothetical protein